MSRPRLTIGTYGEITTRRRPSGRIEARARYREWDGATRLVQASGDTAAAATHALKAKCVDRNLIAPSAGSLTIDSPFPELVAYWLEDIELEDRLATATRQLYERDMRTLVLPAFKDLTLRALAVRHEVLLRNPVDHVARLHRDVRMPDAYTPEEITAIRAAIAYWEAGRDVSGPKPDGQLGVIVEVMLGASARIGEVLAIRRRDIDLSVPSVRIAGTIISPKGQLTARQDHSKTARSCQPHNCGAAGGRVRMRSLAIRNSDRYTVCVTICDRVEVNMDTALLPAMLGYKDLTDAGLTRRQFDRLIEAEEYERIAPGQFLRTGATDDTTAAWMAIASKRPQATLCLLTALSIHDLTDEIPTRSNIAIPRGTKPLTIWSAPITWHHFDTATFDIGRTEHALPGRRTIGLYSAERTIIDLFRLSHEWGSDLAIDALKRWLRVKGNSPSRLLTIAKSFPKGRPALQDALEILL